MDAFTAVADPTRRSILEILLGGPRTAGRIGAKFPHLTQPGVSRHLKVLRDSGLVRVRAEAQHRVYTLQPERFRELESWIQRYVHEQADRLERLAELVDEAPRRRPRRR